MSRTYKFVLVWGLAPAAVAIAALLLWEFADSNSAITFGLLAIPMTVVSLCVGSVLLAWDTHDSLTTPDASHRRIWLRSAICAAVLLANVPLASAVWYAAFAYVVDIRNDSGEVVRNVQLFGPGCEVHIGSIAPGRVVRRRLRLEGDGPLSLRFTYSGKTRVETIDGYVTTSLSGKTHVTIHAGGELQVREWQPQPLKIEWR